VSLSFLGRQAAQESSALAETMLLNCRTVACMASSTRAFFSFSSVSVAAPPDTDAANQFASLLELFLSSPRWSLRSAHELLDSAFVHWTCRPRDDRGVVLVDGHFLGAPSPQFHFSSLYESSVMPAAVRTAMSSSMLRRRQSRALTAAHCSVPRSLFTQESRALA